MRSICRMCREVGTWLEEWCWACRRSVARLAAPRTAGSEIPPDVRKWSKELFATIEELKHTIAELEEREDTAEQG